MVTFGTPRGESALVRGWARELAPLEPRSLDVLIDVTNKCNLRCRMCYFSYDAVFFRESCDMSLATFERVAAAVFPYARKVVLSAANEPLVHPRFPEILAAAATYRPPVLKFLTNGQLLDRRSSEACLDHGVTEIHLSVDGARKETYERIRSGARFDLLLENIAGLVRLKRERGTDTPILHFNVTLMRSNLNELPALVRLARRLGVQRLSCRHVLPYAGLGLEEETLQRDKAAANRGLLRGLEAATREGIEIATYPDFFAEGREDDAPPWRPAAPDRLDAASAPAAAAPAAATGEQRAPFGSVDMPPAPEVEIGEEVEFCGWALGPAGIDRVVAWCDRSAGPTAAGRERAILGQARFVNGARPDVMARFPALPQSYRAGWSFLLNRNALPAAHSEPCIVRFEAFGKDGRSFELGMRQVRTAAEAAAPRPFCAKPFSSVYIDSAANAYPYPDCQMIEPLGTLAPGVTFAEVWHGEPFLAFRAAILSDHPPAICATCPDFINRSVNDPRYVRPRQLEDRFAAPIGHVDLPADGTRVGGEGVEVGGWALGFCKVTRVEIARLPAGAETADPRRPDGLVHVADARLGFDRADIARSHPAYPDSARSGFAAWIAPADLPYGPLRLCVTAWNSAGASTVLGWREIVVLDW